MDVSNHNIVNADHDRVTTHAQALVPAGAEALSLVMGEGCYVEVPRKF
jgi:hypothetical protein